MAKENKMSQLTSNDPTTALHSPTSPPKLVQSTDREWGRGHGAEACMYCTSPRRGGQDWSTGDQIMIVFWEVVDNGAAGLRGSALVKTKRMMLKRCVEIPQVHCILTPITCPRYIPHPRHGESRIPSAHVLEGVDWSDHGLPALCLRRLRGHAASVPHR